VKRFRKSPEFFGLRLENEIERRGHTLILYETPNNKYLNKSTMLVLACKKHGGLFTERKTAHSYLHQKFGRGRALEHIKSCTTKEKEKSKQKRDNAVQSFDQNFINQFYALLNKESEKIFDDRISGLP
jgi:hypothetical protein